MISKELLSEVLKFTKYNFVKEGFIEIEDSTIKYGVKHNIHEKINIHELAHKCKEWALDNKLLGNSGYNLYTEHNIGINYHRSSTENNPSNKNYNYWKCFCSIHDPQRSTIGLGATEPESIFKACQWILDTKEGI